MPNSRGTPCGPQKNQNSLDSWASIRLSFRQFRQFRQFRRWRLVMVVAQQTTNWSKALWTVVRVSLGGLLLSAASLKFAGTGIDPFPQHSALSTTNVRLLAIEIEAVLGLWLLSGFHPRLAWLISVGLFGFL